MNRQAVGIGVVTAGLVALGWFAGLFEPRRAPLVPLDEPASAADARSPRAPAAAVAPGAPVASGGTAAPPTTRVPAEPNYDGPAIHGVVVDFATGEPLAGATIEVGTARRDGVPTPARRHAQDSLEPRDPGSSGHSVSSPTGRFLVPWSPKAAADLIVSAPGHLSDTRLAVTVDDEVRVPLRAGAGIRGRVRRSDGLGIEAALVRAQSTPKDVPRLAALTSTTRSDGEGGFEVLGLPDVSARIVVEHPEYMPTSAQATPGGAPLDVALVAALRAVFRIRTAGGGALAAPLVQWTRTSSAGRPLQVGSEELEFVGDGSSSDAPTNAPGTWRPVRVPSEPADGTVRFVVTAPGRLAWTSDELAVPAGGAERTIDVTLERDPAAGSLSVRVVDPTGHDVTLPREDTIVVVRRTDGPFRPARPVVREGTLTFDGLPAGAYDVFASDRRFGAATVVTTVEGGRETLAQVRLTPPASLRVKIDTGARRRVQFQVLSNGSAVPAFEDPPPKVVVGSATPFPASSRLHFLAGPEGTLIRGLAAGRYAVRIVSPDVAAADTEVDVTSTGTAEVAIRATPR